MRSRFLFVEVNERNFDLPLASVTKDGGVEFRADLNISVWNPGDDTSGYKRVKPGDFVIGLRSFQSGIGASELEGLVSPAYTVLRPTSDLVDQGYFRYLFKSDRYVSRLENVAQGIRQGRTISTEDFYNIEVPVPSLGEQRAIADYLDTETARIDALITKKRRLITLLEERRMRAIERVVDTAMASNHPGTNRLKRVCAIERGRFTHRPRNDPSLYDGPYPFIQTGDVRSARKHLLHHSQTLNAKGRSTSRSFPAGTILMAIAANVGDVAITTYEVHCPDSVVGFVPGVGLEVEFLYYLLVSKRRHINETSTESTQENTNIELLGELPVRLPDIAQQREVSDQLSMLDSITGLATEKLAHQLDLLVEHRQALITAAVTGELRVPGVAV